MDEKKGKKFISEKILGRNLTWERALKYLGLSLLCGLVFGLAAVGIFYLLARPALGRQEETAVSVTETEPTAAAPEETLPESTAETAPEEPQTETEPEETIPETASSEEPAEAETESETEMETETETETGKAQEAKTEAEVETSTAEEVSEIPEEETKMLSVPTEKAMQVCETIRPYLVKAEAVASAETWFDSTVETRQIFSGVVMQKTEDEILVLVPLGAVTAEQKIVVTFCDGSSRTGIPKAYSQRDNLAVLAIPIAGMRQSTLEEILPAELSEKEVRTGMWILAAGAPLGVNGSVDPGIVGFVSEAENSVDTSFRCIYSPVHADYAKGTYVFDEEGKLLGIALPKEGEKICEGTRIVLAKSMERLINNMKAGENSPYLGITGADSEAPEGMYVTGVEVDSPAYEAGLKRGDVIVLAGAREIRRVEDTMGFMRNLHPGETVMLTVKRADGNGGFADIEIEVQAGARD